MIHQLAKGTMLLALTVGFPACDGPIKRNLPQEKVRTSPRPAAGHPKLLKTQGSPKSGTVGCSLQDQAGNLWFGTTGEGVYKFDGKSFRQFTVADGLSSNMVYCMLEAEDGNIWIGTEAGVCLYDGKTVTPIQIPLRPNLPPNQYRNTHMVFSILQDQHGKLWFATIDGVSVYDGHSFTPFSVKESGGGFMSSNPNVEYILEDTAGTLWLGGRGNEGVFRYDGKAITNLTVTEQQDGNWAWPVLQDKQGSIWFSNWGGAYRYDGNAFLKLAGLSPGPITRIIEDQKGNLWFGGGGRGICRYDGQSLTCFTTKDGLIHNDVWSILEDKAGHLWIGTSNTGLSRYDGKTFTSFSDKPGAFSVDK